VCDILIPLFYLGIDFLKVFNYIILKLKEGVMIDKNEYYKAFATWDGYKHLGKHLIEFFGIDDSDLVKITNNKNISEIFIEKYVGE